MANPNYLDYPILLRNAVAFLQKRYPSSAVVFKEIEFQVQVGGAVLFKVWRLIAQDSAAGVQHRAITVTNLGLQDVTLLANRTASLFTNNDITIGFGERASSSAIATAQMPFSGRIMLYTNATHGSRENIRQAFEVENLRVDIIDESAMFKSLFISYGATDVKVATAINKHLKGKGIKTWFFPDDALPGEKLHRMMHDRINHHDRVLLLCSKGALSRAGVLNEIERVLEREAKEGGSDILIPVTIDEYVYGDWAPNHPDLAAQVRNRVISTITMPEDGILDGIPALAKLVRALEGVNPSRNS